MYGEKKNSHNSHNSHDDKDHGHPKMKDKGGIGVVITMGKGGMKDKGGEMRQKAAQGRMGDLKDIKNGLIDMYNNWDPKTDEGMEYDAQLRAFIDNLPC